MVEKDVSVENVSTNDQGTIKIADDVVGIIAGMAAIQVEGVAAMSGGLAGGIVERLGRKNLSKGVKVEVGEKEAAVDIHVLVEYGSRIPEVASQIQARVKNAIESMTGLLVVEVNVHIQGVNFANEANIVDEEKDDAELE
ncbi:MAG TPA: Asp23/Gls24 family envelope stress response protein [Clostridia bacterium]|nr:Asp23/Gls24 family envelope stress response protein [Clostridia bacterium]